MSSIHSLRTEARIDIYALYESRFHFTDNTSDAPLIALLSPLKLALVVLLCAMCALILVVYVCYLDVG